LAATTAFRRVPEGQVFSVYRAGKPHRLLKPGLHALVPGLDRVVHRIDLNGRVLPFAAPLPEARDVHGRVYWQVLEPERADPVLDEVEPWIRRGLLEALEAEPASVGADPRALGSRLKQRLNAALRERGMMVTRVELDFA
jgi:regulator of protease activity HflC (stomatin/prohibitin superfamily)